MFRLFSSDNLFGEMFIKAIDYRIYLRLIIITVTLLISSSFLYAEEELIIPVIKSPFPITAAEWDKYSDTFAYTTNNRTYIRRSLDFELIDTYKKNDESNTTLFYQSPENILYPKRNIEFSGNSVTLYTKIDSNTPAKATTISNLPVSVRNASINHDGTILAITGFDNRLHIFDLETMSEINTYNCNPTVSSIKFTHDNKIVYSDSPRTVKIADLQGISEKTFTCSKNISAIDLSLDEESLILGGSDGTIYVYTTNPAQQIGYIPTLKNNNIDKLVLSADNKKLLASGDDGSIFIIRVQETLFASGAIAPAVKPYEIKYNALNGNRNSEIAITEYSIKEIDDNSIHGSPELIKELVIKEDPKQKFEFAEDKKTETVIIKEKEAEPYVYTQTIEETPSDVLLSQRTKSQNTENLVQEFKQIEPAQKTVNPAPANKTPQQYKTVEPVVVPVKETETPVAEEKTYTTPEETKIPEKKPELTKQELKRIALEERKAEKEAAKAQKEIEKEVAKALKETEKEAAKAKKEAEKEVAKAEKEAEKEATKAEKETVKETPKKKTKFKDWIEDEDIKTFFKDGHGVLINGGYYKMYTDYYDSQIVFPVGYRNYDLIQPFYFGGTAEIAISTPNDSYPYKYHTDTGPVGDPKLLFEKIYLPVGICIYPWKNSLELYFETSFGTALHEMWNGQIGEYSKTGKIFPCFYTNIKFGAAWDFLNLSLCGAYDVITGFAFGLEVGTVINIGGTRKIGSLVQK